jgi:hypothetical protein
MLSTPRKDTLTVVTVTLESGNGAVVATPTTEKLESSSYGRQYFPLAAVVGQVYTIHLSLSLQSGNKKNLFFFSTKFAFANRRSIGF